jgi:protein AbiQ
MKLYSVSDEYIKYLRGKFPRVYSNKEDARTHTRKYLGVVLAIGEHNYYIPLSSPKERHDYIIVNGNKTIRKDSLIVMRIVSRSAEVEELKGTLQIGTMIPVPDSEIELYDVDGELDQAYKDLVLEELIYIRKNEDKIIKNAKILYSKKKADDKNNRLVVNCLDFIAAEAECDKWIYDHKDEKCDLDEKEGGKIDMCRATEALIEFGVDKHLIDLICKKMTKGKSIEVIADEVEENCDKVEAIYNIAQKYLPDYDVDKIYEEMKNLEERS